MSIWAVVPVKRLSDSKSRLSSILDASHRARLSRRLLNRTLRVLNSLDGLDQVLVVSQDPVVLEISRQAGARPLDEGQPESIGGRQPTSEGRRKAPEAGRAKPSAMEAAAETGRPSLNSALVLATQTAVKCGAEALLIVPTDLPLVQPADLASVLALVRSPPETERDCPGSVVIAPDRRGGGTNVMALRPPGVIRYSFGPGSFWRHRSACLAQGIPFHTVRNPRLALDIDLPADLELYRRSESAGREDVEKEPAAGEREM